MRKDSAKYLFAYFNILVDCYKKLGIEEKQSINGAARRLLLLDKVAAKGAEFLMIIAEEFSRENVSLRFSIGKTGLRAITVQMNEGPRYNPIVLIMSKETLSCGINIWSDDKLQDYRRAELAKKHPACIREISLDSLGRGYKSLAKKLAKELMGAQIDIY